MVRNRKFTILILIVSVLALASITEFGRQAVQAIQAQTRLPTQPQRWEYCTVNMITPGTGGWKAQLSRGGGIENVESDITGISTLNRLGMNGWELVSVVHQTGNSAEYFLKRPIR
jgi:hypothetical protein